MSISSALLVMMIAIALAKVPEKIFLGVSAAGCYCYVCVAQQWELGTGYWVETSWGMDWVGDPCSCRGWKNEGSNCPQCSITGNFRVFLHAFAHVFLIAAMLYIVLRLAALTACSHQKFSRCMRYGQAAATMVAGSFAFCGAFVPLPGYVPDEPFCRDDDCASLLVLCPIGLGGLSAVVLGGRILAGLCCCIAPAKQSNKPTAKVKTK